MFSPLIDEETEELSGWYKMTVDYALKHEGKIKSEIRSAARRYRSTIQIVDIEDMYNDVIMYLYSHKDYDINDAINRSSTGIMVSLEGYVNSCVKFCIMRACSLMNKDDNCRVSEIVLGNDDEELSIFDTLYKDEDCVTIDNLVYDLETMCKSCEPIRYRFGADIYLVWYIRLLTIAYKIGDKFNLIMDVLGINKKDIIKLNSCFNDDPVMMSMAKAITATGTLKAIGILEEYVYSAPLIKQAIKNMR